MYGGRNCKRKRAMQDTSNLPFFATQIISQKIPLTEDSETLRPRRKCKENVGIRKSNGKRILDNNESITKPRLNNKIRKTCMPFRSEGIQVSEKLPVKIEKETTKILNLENPKKSILQSIQNLNSKKCDSTVDSIKNNKILQKIPLTEATKTLRPRRGCTKIKGENDSKKTQLPQSNCSAKPISIPKKSEPLISSQIVSDTLEKSTNSEKNIHNLNSRKYDWTVDSIKNNKILQKIPLTEATKTLRPRRTKIVGENDSKENQLPQGKSSAKPISVPKKCKPLISSQSVPETLKELTNSGSNVMTIDENNKKSTLQNTHNLNLANNKDGLKINSKSNRKRPLVCVYQNEGNPMKKTKTYQKKATQENSIMRRFPKWISNGIESFKRGKKSACPSQVYDVERDEDFMLEKSMNKNVVVKKAKVTKIKTNAAKQICKKNRKNYRAKRIESKNVFRKLATNTSPKPCHVLKETKVEVTNHKLFPLRKQIDDENYMTLHTDFNLDENENNCFKIKATTNKSMKASSSSIKQNSPNVEDASNIFNVVEVSNVLYDVDEGVENFIEVPKTSDRPEKCIQAVVSQINNVGQSSKTLQPTPITEKLPTPDNVWKNLLDDLGKSFAVHSTQDKHENCTPVEFAQTCHGVKSSKNLQSIPMTKQSSIPKNVGENLLNNLEKSLEVHLTPDKFVKRTQDEFSRTNSGLKSSKNIQSFPMPQQSSTPENVDRPVISAQVLCRDFDATMLEIQRIVPQEDFSDTEFLSPEKVTSEAVKGKTKSKKEKVLKKLSAVKNLSASLNEQKNKENLKNNNVEDNNMTQVSNGYITASESENLEQTRKITLRPKRGCQQNKHVVLDSSDLELSLESDLVEHEISLFESPQKKPTLVEEPQQCSPSKMVLKKLFPEEFNQSPVKVIEVEDRVLKPRLSYHSPGQFKRFISKTKKESKVVKKVKTKEDILIDSLNQHFSEFENLELCVE